MRASLSLKCLLLAAGLLLTVAARPASAGQQDHQYSTSDIQAGLKLLPPPSARCATARTATRVAASTCAAGSSAAPCPTTTSRASSRPACPAPACRRFKLQPAELDGARRLHPRRLRLGGTAVKVGDAARGQALFDGKGGCATCHRVNGTGRASAPDLSDIGAVRTPAALQRSLLDPTERDAADQSAGAHRDARRPDDPRPPAERRHVHRAAHRRPGAAGVARSRPTSASSSSARRRRCRRWPRRSRPTRSPTCIAYLLSLKGLP